MNKIHEPGPNKLNDLFHIKYGSPDTTGPAPRQRLRFGYFQPSDHYESLVSSLVTDDTAWVDAGGGRALFPGNTFPATYKMNTRKHPRQLFSDGGFEEVLFKYLDDLSVFTNFTLLNYVELGLRSFLNRLGLRYPENCLLGVYEKLAD